MSLSACHVLTIMHILYHHKKQADHMSKKCFKNCNLYTS